jgi:hypothetical protein
MSTTGNDHEREARTRLELLAREAGLAADELRSHLREAVDRQIRVRTEAHGRGRPRGSPRKAV